MSKPNSTKKIIFLAAGVILVGGGLYVSRGAIREARFRVEQGPVPAPLPVEDARKLETTTTPTTKTSDNVEKPRVTSVTSLNLAVPFTSQAPFQVWDTDHEDFCEEASIAMVNAFYRKQTFTRESADRELFSIQSWEKEHLGEWVSTTAEETARILREHYGYKRVDVRYDVTIEDIETEVRAGRPVIVGADGKGLNPNFRNGGPDYHMLVIKGFTPTRFITNDPGTRLGADYTYDKQFLMTKIHDWNGGDVPNGRRAMIVVYPN